MAKFKGYSKVATSDKTMRIIKREHILSVIIAGGYGTELKRTHNFKGDRAPLLDWSKKNDTTLYLTILKGEDNEEFAKWRISKVVRTHWLKNESVSLQSDEIVYSWKDTRKLRIFYDWLHKGKHKTLESVLKYMYSPFLPALLVMESGEFYEGRLSINTEYNFGNSLPLFAQWFEDLFDIHPYIEDNCLFFEGEEMQALMRLIEPIVSEIPSVYDRIYRKNGVAQEVKEIV